MHILYNLLTTPLLFYVRTQTLIQAHSTFAHLLFSPCHFLRGKNKIRPRKIAPPRSEKHRLQLFYNRILFVNDHSQSDVTLEVAECQRGCKSSLDTQLE